MFQSLTTLGERDSGGSSGRVLLTWKTFPLNSEHRSFNKYFWSTLSCFCLTPISQMAGTGKMSCPNHTTNVQAGAGVEVESRHVPFSFPRTYFFLFIQFSAHWVFTSADLLQLQQAGFSSWRLPRSERTFHLRRLPERQHAGSEVVSRDQLPRVMWDLSKPGIKPVSPTLADRFLSTEAPGKTPK